MSPTVTVQKLPLSPISVAPAIMPAVTHIPIHIPDPSDVDHPPFALPPLLTKTSARNSKSFGDRKSLDATFFDKPTSSAQQTKMDKPSSSENVLDL